MSTIADVLPTLLTDISPTTLPGTNLQTLKDCVQVSAF
jgi:hypothetical protein